MTRIVLSLTGVLLPLFIYAGTLINCPPPDCVQGFTVTITYQVDGPCGAYLFAEDLLDGEPSPECLAPVHYAIYREVEASQPGFVPDSDDTSIFLDEDDDLTTIVRVYGIDSNGDYAYCTVYLLIQSSDCTPPLQPLTGTVATENGDPLPGVSVWLMGLDEHPLDTDADGNYYRLIFGWEYMYFSVSVTKEEDNSNNGISPIDLILIQQHILGIQPLGSPYKMIAADVNNSGSISILDIIQLRKLILGTYSDLPDNTDWRFVDASHSFPNLQNPWQTTIPEIVDVNNFPHYEGMVVDFVAIKVGDVNGSADPN